jgi:8-oxo-dGTP pyrophosphatase MutT (NUDIX family)
MTEAPNFLTESDLGHEKILVEEQAVGVLIIKDGKVLTVRNRAGTGLGEGVWGLPSGKKLKVKVESDREAAVRELQQETGLRTEEENLIDFPGNYFQKEIPVNGHHKLMSWRVFICSEFIGELNIEPNDEVMPPEWISLNRLQLYETGPNVPEVIQNGINFLQSRSSE